MNKVLYFEGAGCVPRGDVENCRIRTAFYNDEGRLIYLELSGIERNKHTSKMLPFFNNNTIGFVDHCYYITEGMDDCNDSHVVIVPEGVIVERKYYEYSKQGILDFVNKTLCCSYDEVKILDIFDGYRVHKDYTKETKTGFDKYNIMDDFNYNETLSKIARDNFERLDKESRERFSSQYSSISYIGHDDKSVKIRCHASDEAMRKAKLGRTRNYTIKFGESLPIV